MAIDFDNVATAWLLSLGIGLPIFGAITWACWSRAKSSVLWRIVICLILACAIAPYVVVDSDIKALPAGLLVPAAYQAVRIGELDEGFRLLGIASLCVIITTAVIGGIWYEAILIKRVVSDILKGPAAKR